MKNRFIVMLLVIILALSFVACGGDDTETKAVKEETEQVKEVKESKGAKLDENLTGTELLGAVEYRMPNSLVFTTELTMADGTISTSKTYSKDENMRIESSTQYGDSVMIYNADEGNTYQYNIGEETGIVMNDGEDMDMDTDMSELTLSELTEDATGEIVARVEKLDDEKVIYIEFAEDYGDGEYNIRMWYSIEYSVPLKYEAISDGQVMMSSVVTEIDDKEKIDNKMFTPPSDVEFTDYSMDGMFDSMDDMAEMTEEEMQEMFGEMSEEDLAAMAEMLGE